MEKVVCIKTFQPIFSETKGRYRYLVWEGSATDAGFLMELFLHDTSRQDDVLDMFESIQNNASFATDLFDYEFEGDNALLGYEYAPEEPPCLIISKEKLINGIKQWIWAYGEDKNRITLELSEDNNIRVYAEDGKRKDVWGKDRSDEEW